MDLIKPELAGGFRDYLPADMIPRNRMLEKIKAVFERFGFLPMDTPALERSEVLGKEDSDFLIYRAGLEGVQDMALRYDLTVPLARFYAANADKLPHPFKRYQFGRVWRGEKQQTGKGRYREFTQLDIDTVGSADSMADAEVVTVMYETLSTLGLEGGFTIHINNRKLLDGLTAESLRSIDKLDKIGREAVEKELSADQLELARILLNGNSTNPELDALVANAHHLGVPREALMINNSVVRGLGYYTDNIFEARLNQLPELGSVFSGGRYDNLVSKFAPMQIPAVGASVGVDRLFAALDQLGLLQRELTTAKVLVLNFDIDSRQAVQETATLLRKENIAAEVYLGQENTLKGQLAYAVKQEYPVVLIIGSDERAKGEVQIKDMVNRTAKQVAQSEIIPAVRQLL